jgi:hypothetical protein
MRRRGSRAVWPATYSDRFCVATGPLTALRILHRYSNSASPTMSCCPQTAWRGCPLRRIQASACTAGDGKNHWLLIKMKEEFPHAEPDPDRQLTRRRPNGARHDRPARACRFDAKRQRPTCSTALCTRAIQGELVPTPLKCNELTAAQAPALFTLQTSVRRLAQQKAIRWPI